MKNKYQDAFNELTEINNQLEDNEIGIDELTLKLKRAGELINICRNQLKLTETEVKNILSQFENHRDENDE